MRIAVALPQVPFVNGGAEMMARELCAELVKVGHEADLVTMPFRFSPESDALESIGQWQNQNFETFDIGKIDRVIALKFPAYFANHPEVTVWLLHQHRAAYELAGTDWIKAQSNDLDALAQIKELDLQRLSNIRNLYTISDTVGTRLMKNNRLVSRTIYPPPPHSKDFCSGLAFPYVFFPSRLEGLKRQDLLIRAMAHVKSGVKAVIAGFGGKYTEYCSLVQELGVSDRVLLVGNISHQRMIEYYSNALAVCFTPYDEDYGFVTAEAMLSEKPVVTCTDSGGPTELIRHGDTGFILEPDPIRIADSIDYLWCHRSRAIKMGAAGREAYDAMNISWGSAIDQLLNEK